MPFACPINRGPKGNHGDLDVYVDLDDEPNQNDWGALATACLADADPWGRADLYASSLRVRHSEHATGHMEALYFND